MVRDATTMKFCPKCSSEYDDHVVFCTRDGSPLKTSVGTSTMRSPGMTLSSGRGSALGTAALRSASTRGSSAALALSLPFPDHTPADGLTREVEITPVSSRIDDDIVPGSEMDPYADSPTVAVPAPVMMVSYPPDAPPRPRATDAEPERAHTRVRSTTDGVDEAPGAAGGTVPPRSERTSLDGTEEDDGGGPDLSGRVIAKRYLLKSRLGFGGMGVVYKAIDQRLEKAVAIKVLKEEFSKRQDVVARFTQEAKSVARIKHENVLDVTDYGQSDSGDYYIAMELLVGIDLAQALAMENREPMTVDRATDIAVQICRALGAAHALGVVHRDMKPENVFLVRTDDGRELVKIVDFGIAQMKDTAGGESSRKLTQAGMVFGTLDYMPPEQASGSAIDHRVDVYATGVILYEMFAGRVPFYADTPLDVLRQHLSSAGPPPIHDVNPDADVSPEFAAVIYKALAKEPGQRHASMSEFADELLRARQGTRPTAPADGTHPLRAPTPAAALQAPPQVAPHNPAPPPGWPATVGPAGNMDVEPARRRSPVVPIVVGMLALALVVGLGLLALNRSSGDHVAPPRVGAHPTPTPTAPVLRPVLPTAPAVPPVMPPAVAAPPVVAPAATTVTMVIETSPAGGDVRGVAEEGNRELFNCRAPCTQQVAPQQWVRLSARKGNTQGIARVMPTNPTTSVVIPLAVVPNRPRSTPSGGRTSHPRCGEIDPVSGLMTPCFDHGATR